MHFAQHGSRPSFESEESTEDDFPSMHVTLSSSPTAMPTHTEAPTQRSSTNFDAVTFNAVSARAQSALQQAKSIFLMCLAHADLSTRKRVTAEIVRFHLVPKCRIELNQFIRANNCIPSNRFVKGEEKDAYNRTRKSQLVFTAVTFTAEAQRKFWSRLATTGEELPPCPLNLDELLAQQPRPVALPKQNDKASLTQLSQAAAHAPITQNGLLRTLTTAAVPVGGRLSLDSPHSDIQILSSSHLLPSWPGSPAPSPIQERLFNGQTLSPAPSFQIPSARSSPVVLASTAQPGKMMGTVGAMRSLTFNRLLQRTENRIQQQSALQDAILKQYCPDDMAEKYQRRNMMSSLSTGQQASPLRPSMRQQSTTMNMNSATMTLSSPDEQLYGVHGAIRRSISEPAFAPIVGPFTMPPQHASMQSLSATNNNALLFPTDFDATQLTNDLSTQQPTIFNGTGLLTDSDLGIRHDFLLSHYNNVQQQPQQQQQHDLSTQFIPYLQQQHQQQHQQQEALNLPRDRCESPDPMTMLAEALNMSTADLASMTTTDTEPSLMHTDYLCAHDSVSATLEAQAAEQDLFEHLYFDFDAAASDPVPPCSKRARTSDE